MLYVLAETTEYVWPYVFMWVGIAWAVAWATKG